MYVSGICNGFRDLHYITFDGIYYSFQGNSSLVLVQEIDPKYNFSVVVDNICDIEDDLSCPKSLVVHYKSFKIFMTQRVSAGAVMNLVNKPDPHCKTKWSNFILSGLNYNVLISENKYSVFIVSIMNG